MATTLLDAEERQYYYRLVLVKHCTAMFRRIKICWVGNERATRERVIDIHRRGIKKEHTHTQQTTARFFPRVSRKSVD